MTPYNLLQRRDSAAHLHTKVMELEAKLDNQRDASRKLVKRHKTLVAKIEKLEWVASVLSTVYSLSMEDSGTAVAFQRHLFSDEELDLHTAVQFIQEVKRHLKQTDPHIEALTDDE